MANIGRRLEKTTAISAISLILLICFPIASVPFIIAGMLKNKKWGYFQWAFLMGLVGILIPPTGDLYRYAINGIAIGGLSWHSFLTKVFLFNDYFLWFLSYLLSYLNLNVDLTRFVFNFTVFYLLGKICHSILSSNKRFRRKDYIYVIGILITLSLKLYLFRYWFASIVLIYGAYLLVFKNNRKGWWLLLLSVTIHLTMVIFVALIGLQQLGFFKFKRWHIVVIGTIALGMDTGSAILLLNILPDNLVTHYIAYLDGYWAGEYLQDSSWKFRVFNFFMNSEAYIAILIYFLIYRNNIKKIIYQESLVNLFFILALIGSISATIYGRFLGVLLVVIKIFFLNNYSGSYKQFKYLKIMFFTVMISNILNIYSIRRELAISDMPELIYSSTPLILSHSYDLKWIVNNVDSDGGFY